ncbi:MAG: hypothetical protein ACI9K8_000938, partial [Reinekea sp.]
GKKGQGSAPSGIVLLLPCYPNCANDWGLIAPYLSAQKASVNPPLR